MHIKFPVGYFSTYRHHLHVCDKVTRSQQPAAAPSTTMEDHQPASDSVCNLQQQHHLNASTGDSRQLSSATAKKTSTFDCTNRLASIFLKLRAYYNLSHVALDFIAVELLHLLVDMENDAMEYKNKLKMMPGFEYGNRSPARVQNAATKGPSARCVRKTARVRFVH